MPFREVLFGPKWVGVAGVSTLVFLGVVTAIAAPVVVGGVQRISGWTIALLITGFLGRRVIRSDRALELQEAITRASNISSAGCG